jgi:hypothetical protein
MKLIPLHRTLRVWLLTGLASGLLGTAALGQTSPRPESSYSLLSGSRLTDECPICDRIPIVVPLQGTFSLQLMEENPLYSIYAWNTIAWTAATPGGISYRITGHGLYQVGGEVALLQDLSLEVFIDNGWTNQRCFFTITNGTRQVPRAWPLLEITVDQTNGTEVQQYRLELVAAPVREIWFSTTAGFTPGASTPWTNHVSSGDLVSSTGRVVKRNQELTQRLGMMPSPDPSGLGLDAVDILPGGEIAFSIETDVFSESLGPLHQGDVLSDRGRVVRGYADLIAPFGLMPPVADPGLDALQILDSGEIYFSVKTAFYSERLGVWIQRGDLLSSGGRVVKTEKELLSRFHPSALLKECGLQAVFVWPGGEVWFSLEEGFQDDLLGDLRPGDLLSDRGELLYRNRELLREFQPLEELVDFGLDALYVVSDALAPAQATVSWTASRPDPATGDLPLQWKASGRLYQLEKATNVLGPWPSLSPIMPDSQFTDTNALTLSPQAFYRLRQW